MPRLDQLQSMLARQPDDVFLNFALAMELQKLGRLDESVDALRRTLAAKPGYLVGWQQLGKVLLLQGKTAEAAETWRRAIDVAVAAGDPHGETETRKLLLVLEQGAASAMTGPNQP